ncbi:hypothetical protein R6Z07F_000587 [Ovis aries]
MEGRGSSDKVVGGGAEKNSAVQLLVLNESVRKGKLANNQTGVLPFKQLLSRFFIRISLGCKGFSRFLLYMGTAPMVENGNLRGIRTDLTHASSASFLWNPEGNPVE